MPTPMAAMNAPPADSITRRVSQVDSPMPPTARDAVQASSSAPASQRMANRLPPTLATMISRPSKGLVKMASQVERWRSVPIRPRALSPIIHCTSQTSSIDDASISSAMESHQGAAC